MMRAVEAQVVAELPGGGDERDRKVVVDVRVHPRHRELQRRDSRLQALLKQRRPDARHRALCGVGLDRVEVELCEDRGEPGEEGGVLEAVVGELGPHSARDGKIEAVEDPDAVTLRHRACEGLHACRYGVKRIDLEVTRRCLCARLDRPADASPSRVATIGRLRHAVLRLVGEDGGYARLSTTRRAHSRPSRWPRASPPGRWPRRGGLTPHGPG